MKIFDQFNLHELFSQRKFLNLYKSLQNICHIFDKTLTLAHTHKYRHVYIELYTSMCVDTNIYIYIPIH